MKTARQKHNAYAASFPRLRGRGERNPASKLSAEVVRIIRRSTASSRELAAFLNVSQSTVVRARNSVTWKDA